MSKRSSIVRGAAQLTEEMLVLHGDGAGFGHGAPSARYGATAHSVVVGAQEHAEAIVAEARQRATAITAAAEGEQTRVLAEAHAEGLHRGMTDGLESVAQETAQLLDVLRVAARSGQQLRDALVAGAERQVVELALEVARKILGHRARLESDLVLDMARKAIARAGTQEIVRIRVNPDQAAIVSAALASSDRLRMSGGPDGTDLAVDGDSTIDLGGCIVDTRAGLIDARLETQVDQVGNALLALTAAFDD